MDTQVNFNQDINEEERMKVLRKYDILDTPPDSSFDKLTKLAAKLFNVPIAIISIVDTERIWFKSAYGTETRQIARNSGLCASAILSDKFYSVTDIATDSRTSLNVLIYSESGGKFYAAMPLRTKDNFNLGTFCLIDENPRELTKEEEDILGDLRDVVMNQIELKFASKLVSAQYNQALNTTAHDLKNPLTTIPVRADLIKLKKDDPEVVDKMCDQIKTASLNMVRIIDELLQSGTIEAGKVQLLLIKLNVSSVVANVVSMNQALAERKGQTLSFNAETNAIVNADEGKLSEIIDNLINNAIKYSPADTRIEVSVKAQNNKILIIISDEGPGLTNDDKERLFQRFTRLSAQPTGGENSTGLGLSIVKMLVEAHEGRIWAESDGQGKGSRFIVELPVWH